VQRRRRAFDAHIIGDGSRRALIEHQAALICCRFRIAGATSR
jgi:hypothetical protein